MDVMLRPGDVFLTRSTSLLGKLIRICTRDFGEKRSKVNHVGIVVEAGGMKEAVVVEALSMVREHKLWKQYSPPKKDWVAVYRSKNVSLEEMEIIVATAKRQVGKKYGYLKIATHFLDWCFSGIYFFRWFARNGKYPICSWLVAHAYGKAGYDFEVDIGEANPDDIWDFVNDHPHYYGEIVHLGPLPRFS